MFLTDLVVEASIFSSGYDALLIQHGEETERLVLKKGDTIGIVREVQRIPVDAFGAVELLFALEDEGVEEVLQPLVREVDAQLLEGVKREALEPEDVEDPTEEKKHLRVSDRSAVANRLIRPCDDLKEQTPV